MEQIYALGVSCIELIQYWFSDYEGYFEMMNNLSNPHNSVEYLFPVVAIIDSVFATQLLLCLSFGGWLNSVMKWWLLEDRPYWWVRETGFYSRSQRPHLIQHLQTCETGPGSPSGHSANTGMLLMLAVMWMSHVMNDRRCYIKWWKPMAYPLFATILCSVMFARMFVAAHFPHQVMLGALIGIFLAPALCIYVCDPYIWGNLYPVTYSVKWHTASAIMTIAIGVLTYYSLKVCGWDPQWSVKLAFRWCEYPSEIHVSTTPMFALVQSTSALLGMALAVTPAVKHYRHYTKNRSLIVSTLTTAIILYSIQYLKDNIDTNDAMKYYTSHFLIGVVRPALLLRVMPVISMWPFGGKIKDK